MKYNPMSGWIPSISFQFIIHCVIVCICSKVFKIANLNSFLFGEFKITHGLIKSESESYPVRYLTKTGLKLIVVLCLGILRTGNYSVAQSNNFSVPLTHAQCMAPHVNHFPWSPEPLDLELEPPLDLISEP